MDPTPVKTLFQWKNVDAEAHTTLRLAVLLQESTLVQLLEQMRSNGKNCAHATMEMPAAHFTVMVEAYDPEKIQKNDLKYTEWLKEKGFNTDHVNLV